MLPIYVICKNSDGSFICPNDDSTEIKTKNLPTVRPFADNGKTDEQKEKLDNYVKSVTYGGNISQGQQVVKNDTGGERCSENEFMQTGVKIIVNNGIKLQHQNNSVAHAVEKLKLNCRMMQTFFAESLFERTFQRKTFRLLEEKDGSPLIHLFHSKLDICDVPEMTGGDLYDFFHKGKFLVTLEVFQQLNYLKNK